MKISMYFKIITATFVAMTFAMGFLALAGAPARNVSTEELVTLISALTSMIASGCADRFEKEDC